MIRTLLNRMRNALASFVSGGYELLAMPRGSSDYPVNDHSILTYAPIFYSACKISGHMAQMPREIKRLNSDESIDTVPQHSRANNWQGRLNRLLNLDPNGLQTAADLIETVQKDALISANGRLAIVRQGGRVNGEPVQLIRLSPATTWSFLTYQNSASTTVDDMSDNGTAMTVVDKWHAYTTTDGKTGIIHDDDCLHIKGLQHDGLSGLPLWYVGRDSIGGGKTAEAMTNRLFSNDGIPGLILEAPFGVLNNETKAQEFLEEFRSQHSGRNAGRTGLLRMDVKAKQLAQDNRAAQLLENRQFSRDEAWLLTGDIEFYAGADNVYRNGNELNAAYRSHTLARWALKWNQEMSLKLLSRRQQDLGWYIEVDLMAILRGTLETQAGIIQTLRATGTISEEDSRRWIGRSPARKPGENYDNPNTSRPSASENAASAPETLDSEQETSGETGDSEQIPPEGRVISSDLPRLTGPAQDRPQYQGCIDRDRWIYEQHAGGILSMREILEAMPEAGPTWDLIGTIRGARLASHRYADYAGLPRVNRNIPSGSELAPAGSN